MPAEKTDFSLFAAQSLTGGAGPTTSGWVDLQTGYGGIWYISITNGISRQAKGVEVQVQIAKNQVAGNDYDWDCRKIAAQDASEESKFVVRVPLGAKFSRVVITHGDQDAVATVDFTRTTQV